MTVETLERLVDTYLFYGYPTGTFAFQGGSRPGGLPFFEKLVELQNAMAETGRKCPTPFRPTAGD